MRYLIIIVVVVMALLAVASVTDLLQHSSSEQPKFHGPRVNLAVVEADTCVAEVGAQSFSLKDDEAAFVAAMQMQAEAQKGTEPKEVRVLSQSGVPMECTARVIMALQRAGFLKIGAIAD